MSGIFLKNSMSKGAKVREFKADNTHHRPPAINSGTKNVTATGNLCGSAGRRTSPGSQRSSARSRRGSPAPSPSSPPLVPLEPLHLRVVEEHRLDVRRVVQLGLDRLPQLDEDRLDVPRLPCPPAPPVASGGRPPGPSCGPPALPRPATTPGRGVEFQQLRPDPLRGLVARRPGQRRLDLADVEAAGCPSGRP